MNKFVILALFATLMVVSVVADYDWDDDDSDNCNGGCNRGRGGRRHIKDRRYHRVDTGNESPLPRGTWDFAPESRSSFLAFGGLKENLATDNYVFYNDLWQFTYLGDDSGKWKKLNPSGPIPSARAFHGFDTVEASNGKKYACVYGGASSFQPFVVNPDSFYCYDIQENKWINLSHLPGPGPRSGPQVSARGSELWIVAGVVPDPTFFFKTLDDTWKFDINCMNWTKIVPKNNYTPARHIPMGGWVKDEQGNDKLMMYGGETIAPFFDFGIANDTWEYSVTENTWYLVSDTDPTPRRNYACVVIAPNKRSATLFGGDEPGPNDSNPINDLWDYNVLRAEWKERPTVASTRPPPTKRHACERIGDQMFIGGGYTVNYFPNGTIKNQPFLMDVYSIGL